MSLVTNQQADGRLRHQSQHCIVDQLSSEGLSTTGLPKQTGNPLSKRTPPPPRTPWSSQTSMAPWPGADFFLCHWMQFFQTTNHFCAGLRLGFSHHTKNKLHICRKPLLLLQINFQNLLSILTPKSLTTDCFIVTDLVWVLCWASPFHLGGPETTYAKSVDDLMDLWMDPPCGWIMCVMWKSYIGNLV